MLVEIAQKRSVMPLTAWELPKLLEPMHRWKRPKRGKEPALWRPHFLPILGFVYRNRFAVASQIQRRFPKALPSDRTTRRHLAALQATGCLGVADTRSTSPLFPKVFFVTGRGVRRIEETLRERGKSGRCCRRDRGRPEAYSPDHVLHEILTTEFLLNVWQTVEQRSDLQLLTMQRRSLERHPAFVLAGSSGRSRLKPDAMFLYKQDRGLMCCFLELDNGTMSTRQMESKFARYEAWAQSSAGHEYLLKVYREHGAEHARPRFRVLVVTRSRQNRGDDRRRTQLIQTAMKRRPSMSHQLWFATVDALKQNQGSPQPLSHPIWLRGGKRMANRQPGSPDQFESLF